MHARRKAEIERDISETVARTASSINDREWQLVVPKFDNAGRPIRPEILEDIAFVVAERFGGMTIYPSVGGCFIPDSGEMEGELICEENMIITAVRDSEEGVPMNEDEEFLRGIAEEIGEDLGQISVMVTEDTVEAEFVPGEFKQELGPEAVRASNVFRDLL